MGDEGVPVQVDGEAWIQPPGYMRIVHKNRAQVLTRDRVSAHFQLFTVTFALIFEEVHLCTYTWVPMLVHHVSRLTQYGDLQPAIFGT
jgi:hypothetical protein